MVEMVEVAQEESFAEELEFELAEAIEEVEEPAPLSQPQHILTEAELPFVMESLIFASAEPLTLAAMKEVFGRQGFEFSDAVLRSAIGQIEEKWQVADRPYGQGIELTQIAGGYVFRTNPKFGFAVRTLLQEKPQKLAPSQLEILAIVSYRQPVTRVEVEEIRGVDSSAGMRRLLGLKLIKILGKSQGLGRPLLYGTTKQFLEFFGLNSLHDLPTLKQFQDLGKDGPSDAEKAASEEGPINLTDLFADRENHEMFSEHTEKLSQDALESLEKALGVVANAADKLDIEKALNFESE
jgi:segregation and condensation protein B